VLVVDDSDPFRALMRDVVSLAAGLTCVGEARSGEEALEAVEALAPRMVVMDKRMPGLGGVETARRIRARHPGVVVALVSVEDPSPQVIQASGADVVLPKRELSPRALAELWRAHAA